MTNAQSNQIIHKAMGLCWHEYIKNSSYECVCGYSSGDSRYGLAGHMDGYNPSYTSDWSAYGKALEWAQKQKWWAEFAYEVRTVSPYVIMAPFLRDDLLVISEGSTALAEFITEHPEYFKKEDSNDKK